TVFTKSKLQMVMVLAAGSVLGYGAASGKFTLYPRASASTGSQSETSCDNDSRSSSSVCSSEACTNGDLLAAGGDDQKPAGQQAAGAPGSPSATTTIDGRYIPNPPAKFGGEIAPNALQSKPYWPARVVPPKGAPNVLLIMTDDTGFGASSTFGGVIPTPSLERVAKMGLRYTNMNSTPLRSPS